MTKITDPDMLDACRFISGYYKEIGAYAPKKFGPEEQHAIIVLAAYIRSKRT